MAPVSYTALFHLLLPEVILIVTALLVLAADLVISRTAQLPGRFTMEAVISGIGCIGAIIEILRAPQQANVFDGTFVTSLETQHIQIALLVLTVLIVSLSIGSSFTSHVGEYFAVTLFATVGMMLLVSSQNVLLIFISLELLSLSLYVLAGLNKRSPHSAEAALKYFLFGGTSAAFLLFGLSLLYGLSNSTNLVQIAHTIKGSPLNPLMAVAIAMIVLGFGFKVAAVPFHFWAPDVYQGAPANSAALISSTAKVAGFVIFYQVMTIGFAGAEGSADWRSAIAGWVPVVAIVAALSMFLGNLVAITQTSVRRLLAYSAIAHAGYMLLALVSHTEQSFVALLYYAITYALTLIGAFGVVSIIEEQVGGEKLSDFAGLSRRAPLLSLCMLIFMLSLGGIPPLAGFFGKFFLFASTLSAGQHTLDLLWLVVVAVAMSTVSLYYYLQVLKRIYVAEPVAGSCAIQVPIVNQLVLCAIALSILLLGCVPDLFLKWLYQPIGIGHF